MNGNLDRFKKYENFMSIYNNVLVAIDPFIDSNKIIIQAKKITKPDGNMRLIYVMESLMAFPSAPFAPPMVDLPGVHKNTRQAAYNMMLEVAKKYDIPKENVHLEIGSIAREIKKFASDTNADAIVIGSHGRHGVGLLLGSTASSVIHGVSCDMLIVKIEA
jgi:universal stress protein A